MTKREWQRRVLPMSKNHQWRTKDGYNIFVADRGIVRFNYPKEWLVRPADDCIRFYDAEPPADNFTLGVSYIRLPAIDWSKVSLESLVRDVAQNDERDLLEMGELVHVARSDMEIAWVELKFIDPVGKRPAFGRYGMARGSNIQVLLTLDDRPEHAHQIRPVWDEILRSLVLGRTIADPTQGDMLH